jgi:RNA polymerase sigma factor (sigma-70 family)
MSAVVSSADTSRKAEWSDERLVKACIKGDEDAWSLLIDKYKNLIFSIPIKYEFSREDASDIFQSICVELVSELPRLREPRALPKWLIQATSHKCQHWKRREHRYVATEEIGDVRDQRQTARAEEIIGQVQEQQILRESLRALRPRCMQLIQMLFFRTPAPSYREIAQQLGLATGSIGFIRGRCLDQLRKQLLSRGWK